MSTAPRAISAATASAPASEPPLGRRCRRARTHHAGGAVVGLLVADRDRRPAPRGTGRRARRVVAATTIKPATSRSHRRRVPESLDSSVDGDARRPTARPRRAARPCRRPRRRRARQPRACCSGDAGEAEASAASTVAGHGPGATPAPKLAGDDLRVEQAEPEAVVLLGDEHGEPALLGEALPQRGGCPSPCGSSTTPRTASRSNRSARNSRTVVAKACWSSVSAKNTCELLSGGGRARARRRCCAGPGTSRPRW